MRLLLTRLNSLIIALGESVKRPLTLPRLAVIGFAIAGFACTRLRGGEASMSQLGSLLAIVVDQPTGTPLGGTLASVRPAGEPLGSSRKFSPIDTAGVLRIGGLKLGRYAVHLKRIGYVQKDTTLTATSRPMRTVIPMQRDSVTLR
jgi:hypothetical protein